MARKEHILTVFAASPNDVAEERNKLEEIVRELNITWSRQLGLRLDLVKWETHAYPGIGTDPQDVVNTQIPDDYDIFIGIMWHRFGTPTGRYGSGTVEEFERARQRVQELPNSVDVMFYFRDSPPLSISQIDARELLSVQEFRQSLGEKGALYWPYKDVNDFEKLLRIHLSRITQKWKPAEQSRGATYAKANEPSKDDGCATEPIDEDFGIIDLTDIMEEEFQALAEITNRMHIYMDELTKKINDATSEIGVLPRIEHDPRTVRQEAKKLMARLSLDLVQFSERTDTEIPLFQRRMSNGLNALLKSIHLGADFAQGETYKSDLRTALATINEMNDSISETLKSIGGFREAAASLPRMTGDINKAKRRVVETLDRLITELRSGVTLGAEAAESIQDLLNK
ncbi:DUF4062 domain-containing protein [Chelativorans sp.]|uniref:DUF4062 domain-containing protein n=1 Tax=Chelativorans sp. TaxID=2203393 RepID=UPI002811B54E|nr:DUF4062 domain-containing protein [Chelativorans sp.]